MAVSNSILFYAENHIDTSNWLYQKNQNARCLGQLLTLGRVRETKQTNGGDKTK